MKHNSHEQPQSNKMFLLGFTLTANHDLWADVKVGVAGRAIAQVQKARDLSP